MSINSDINLNLPQVPMVTDPILQRELIKIYDAFRILQTELSDAKSRIKALEPAAK